MSGGDDAELDEIRKRKLLEAQQRGTDDEARVRARQQAEQQKQALLRQILTPEARQRISNLKMVKPDFAEAISVQLIQIAQSGRIRLPITDEQLKEILSKLGTRQREINIRRI